MGVSFGFGGKLVSFHSKAAAGRASEVLDFPLLFGFMPSFFTIEIDYFIIIF